MLIKACGCQEWKLRCVKWQFLNTQCVPRSFFSISSTVTFLGCTFINFFIFLFLPSNTLFFISHFFPNSYPPCCSTLRVNSLFCLWEISPLHCSVTGWGWGGTHLLLEASLEFVLHFCSLWLCERMQLCTLWRSLNVTLMDMLLTKC